MKKKAECIIEKIYITDIGWLMIKVFNPKKQVWINYPIINLYEKDKKDHK